MRLRPHHLIDIFTQYGAGTPFRPHAYGHAVHSVAECVIADPDQEVCFIVGADEICAPCRNLADGQCVDMLRRLDPPLSKQEYNDGLDRRLLAHLEMAEGDVLTVRAYANTIRTHWQDIERVCTHPNEDPAQRRANLDKGLAKIVAPPCSG